MKITGKRYQSYKMQNCRVKTYEGMIHIIHIMVNYQYGEMKYRNIKNHTIEQYIDKMI